MFATKVHTLQYTDEGFASNFICAIQIPVYLTASTSSKIVSILILKASYWIYTFVVMMIFLAVTDLI